MGVVAFRRPAGSHPLRGSASSDRTPRPPSGASAPPLPPPHPLLLPFGSRTPLVPASAFVAPGAALIGDAALGEDASIWFGAVLRADLNSIRVGRRSNLQDGVVVHVNAGDDSTTVADEVTVGHRAVLHGCRLETRCLVGMGSVVLDGAVVGAEAMVAAGALVPPGLEIPPRTLARGVPARVARPLSDAEIAHLEWSAAHYVALKDRYLAAERSNPAPGSPA